MSSFVHELHRYADVVAALSDPHLVPPPAESGPPGSVAWLRARVARFSSGEVHARRRALVETELARLDPATLRRVSATARPTTSPDSASAPDGDLRLIVIRAMAECLGLAEPDALAEAVTIVARAYFGGGDDAEADAAVAWLLPRLGGVDEQEAAANRIGLLVQACATGDLIGNARLAADGLPAGYSIEALLAETLRHDPPVRVMRRLAVRDTRVAGIEISQGDLVILNIAAANRDPEVFADPKTFDLERSGPAALTFGGGRRRCPGSDHALALAAGVLGAATADDLVIDDRDPAEVLGAMVEHVLAFAASWTAWDGRVFPIDGRIYTPHKAIRRVTDHLVDHLAEMEARLAGEQPQPDRWHASAITTDADLAPFTPADLDEAGSRLTRLARIWANRLDALTPDQLDHSPGRGWSVRQLAFHLAGSAYYADAVGDLTAAEPRQS